jgi:signal transduction histidine kinase
VLSLSKDEKENMAVISVIDNGQGISSDLLEHLFEPFVQAEQGLDRSYGGLGLGLPIVKGIIDNHGGIIKVLSEGLGMGTTFTIGLPLLEEIN